ncbi:MAG: hypothetical protein ACMXYF_04170 [Candidatus Woesearchaeota archaeon]
MNKKSQGATEYLILLSLILILLVVAILPLFEFPAIGSSAEVRASQSYWSASDIGIVAHVANQTHLFLVVQNNLAHSINITNISLNSNEHSILLVLDPREQGNISVFTEQVQIEEVYRIHIDFTYKNLRNFQTYQFYGEVPILGERQDSVQLSE